MHEADPDRALAHGADASEVVVDDDRDQYQVNDAGMWAAEAQDADADDDWVQA